MTKNFALIFMGCVSISTANATSCTDKGFAWSATTPSVNRQHIFCGEVSNNKPKGFHSQQLLATSTVVTGVTGKVSNGKGIYSATVTFKNGSSKQSTFYPDNCTVDQIVTSVVYAANNQTGHAKQWGELGYSAPKTGGVTYCLNAEGKPFTIRMGLIESANGVKVNTAFPQP